MKINITYLNKKKNKLCIRVDTKLKNNLSYK